MTILEVPTHAERKRLGQYFTGSALSRLLAELAKSGTARRVIDPMAGSGDLLVAAAQTGGGSERLDAVEIDPRAADVCRLRLIGEALGSSSVQAADAFAPSTWHALGGESWDLVITNPPYVRYQRGSVGSLGNVEMPSAADVRAGLIAILEARTALPDNDRRVWRRLAEEYGGLSDLAVPSWILCASLVAPGGRLAIVAPDTWLSRDYALPVLYLLRRYFEIEAVVEDGDASWFPDALVRTTLLVARRVEDRGSGLAELSSHYPHVRLDAVASTPTSVVGSLYPERDEPERTFVSDMRLEATTTRIADRIRRVPDSHLCSLVRARASSVRWMAEVEAAESGRTSVDNVLSPVVHVPSGVAHVIGVSEADAFITLGELGWQVGQGLRTGANRFFYCTAVDDDLENDVVNVDRWLSRSPLHIPKQLLSAVVRKQQDHAGGMVVAGTPGRVLLLEGFALPEDIDHARRNGVRAGVQPLTGAAADLVRRAAHMPVGTGDDVRSVPDLSAVATNVRRADRTRPDRHPRYWYHLPALAQRHRPEVFMPRVNHFHPVAILNRDLIVDANFSSFWSAGPTMLPAPGLVALLNSSWVTAVLETSGTVLGGGALKVEATHLRSLPVPRFGGEAMSVLSRIGTELSHSRASFERLRVAADEILEAALARIDGRTNVVAALRAFSTRHLENRNSRAVGARTAN